VVKAGCTYDLAGGGTRTPCRRSDMSAFHCLATLYLTIEHGPGASFGHATNRCSANEKLIQGVQNTALTWAT
jgi:hypothetical protein